VGAAAKAIFSRGIGAAALVCALAPVGVLFAQQGAQRDIAVYQVRPNFYMISGAGANIGVQFGSDGVVVADTGTQEASAAVLAEIRKLSDKPVRYIINTSADADSAGGNATIAKAGQSIFSGVSGPRSDFVKAMTGGLASIVAHENVLTRMSAPTGKASPFPSDGWPSEAFATNRRYLYLNHEGIEVLHQPAAHSDGDSVVFFRGSDVVMAGDILDTTRLPVIDVERGGGIEGEIDALNRLIELAIPSVPFIFQPGGTYVIPGHGRIYDQADIVEFRDMIVILRDVIQDMKQHGMTLAQIQAANPVLPYEKQYGAKSGAWTTNNFIEAVYKSAAVKK
jgi:glyoxylase-like metal-dependent hydrolase (beta-lactamase superfamily II)